MAPAPGPPPDTYIHTTTLTSFSFKIIAENTYSKRSSCLSPTGHNYCLYIRFFHIHYSLTICSCRILYKIHTIFSHIVVNVSEISKCYSFFKCTNIETNFQAKIYIFVKYFYTDLIMQNDAELQNACKNC